MELFKRYVAASSMGVVALVCVLVGLLGVTVLRPPTHQVSSVFTAFTAEGEAPKRKVRLRTLPLVAGRV